MSDYSQGSGWWQASDGKWYPPEAVDQTQAIPTAQPAYAETTTTYTTSVPPPQRKGMSPWLLLPAAVLSWLIGLVMGVGIGGAGDDDPDTDVAAVATSTTLEAETTTTEQTTTTAKVTTTSPPATAPPTTAPKQFVEVTRLSGTSEKRGEVFELNSGSRMRYESSAGFFAVYVMDEGDSLEENGGFPEVTCTEPCNDTTQLAKKAGRYYLEVKSSGGAWTVIIEELR